MNSMHNLYVVRGRSRKTKPLPGDVFGIHLPGGKYIIGRVIVSPIKFSVTNGCTLIYLYKELAVDLGDIPFPKKPNLLLPPMFVTNIFWTKGIFQHLRHVPLLVSEILPRHVFRTFIKINECDEFGCPLKEPIEPGEVCGFYALEGWKSLDEKIEDMRL